MKEAKGPIGSQGPLEPWAFRYLVGNKNRVMLIASCSSVRPILQMWPVRPGECNIIVYGWPAANHAYWETFIKPRAGKSGVHIRAGAVQVDLEAGKGSRRDAAGA